jgi:integrase
MMRDARKHGICEKDHFADLEWARVVLPKPDPFAAEERDAILKHFKEKHRFYYSFVLTLFGTGARPSEIIALRWGDVDLKAGMVASSQDPVPILLSPLILVYRPPLAVLEYKVRFRDVQRFD